MIGPLWKFGLSEYNPFQPSGLPGGGMRMYDETLNFELLEEIQHAGHGDVKAVRDFRDELIAAHQQPNR